MTGRGRLSSSCHQLRHFKVVDLDASFAAHLVGLSKAHAYFAMTLDGRELRSSDRQTPLTFPFRPRDRRSSAETHAFADTAARMAADRRQTSDQRPLSSPTRPLE
jgi:hypothetical protein